MKHCIIIALLFSASITHAQAPTLTRTNYYTLDDKFLRITKIDTGLNAITIDSGGANATWDFSSVDFAHPSVMVDTITCLLPDSTPFFHAPSVNYDTSTLALRIDTDPFSPEDDNYIYYLADNNALQFVGAWANNGGSERTEYSFTNLRTDLIFPFTFNDTYTDSFQSSYNDQSGSGWHYQTGALTLTADGYGTFITPDGDTLEDALRLKQEMTIRDSSDLFGASTSDYLTYYWYAASERGPVLQLDMDVSTPGAVLNAYYFKNLHPASTSVVNAALPQVHLYPNPSAKMFTVSMDERESRGFTISVFNVAGKLLHKENNTGASMMVYCESFPAGMYFVEVCDAKGQRIVEKVLVE